MKQAINLIAYLIVILFTEVVKLIAGFYMNFSNELINEYKSTKGIKTDAEVAELLPEMHKGNLSKIRKGSENRHLNEEQALYIATECGLNPQWVLVQLAEEKARSEEAKAVWSHLAKKLSRTVTAAALAVSLVFCGVQSDNSSKAVFA